MNTKLATTQINLKNWALIIKDQRNSGLKVKDYCNQHNLSKDAFYYWFKKVKEAALNESGFVEISQPAPIQQSLPGTVSSGECRLQCKDIQITLPLSVSRETLEMLCEVITHVK